MQIGINIAIKGAKTSSPPSNPVNTVAPVIDGNADVGSTLTLTSVGTYTGAVPITYTYQWYRGVTAIIGQTSTTYITQSADAGEQVTCQVHASNAYGGTFVSSNYIIPAALFAPFNITLPAIDTFIIYGVNNTIVLEVGSNTWDGNPVPVLTYQWLRNGNNITGATSATYLTVTADLAQTISVQCTATNSQGSASEDSNNVIIV